MRIARTPEGKRIRIGEGGNSVVYKAVMHNYDEVALKLVRMTQPSQAELQLFEKEVSCAACLLFRLVAVLLAVSDRHVCCLDWLQFCWPCQIKISNGMLGQSSW